MLKTRGLVWLGYYLLGLAGLLNSRYDEEGWKESSIGAENINGNVPSLLLQEGEKKKSLN